MTAATTTELPRSATLLPTRRSFRIRHHRAVVLPLRALTLAGRVLNNLLTVVAVAAFLGLAVGPHLFGYRTTTMLTGSMAPTIEPGDVEIVTPLPVSRIAVGDVISYHIPVLDHRVVSHRVVGVTRMPDGTTDVQTKGDANPGPDPWVATFDGGDVYRVDHVIPEIGNVIRLLRAPQLHLALQYGAPALAGVLALSLIWRRPGGQARAGGRS